MSYLSEYLFYFLVVSGILSNHPTITSIMEK